MEDLVTTMEDLVTTMEDLVTTMEDLVTTMEDLVTTMEDLVAAIEDLVTTMENICNNNKMWVVMWTTELAQRAMFEECMLVLLEQQCLTTQMTWLQLYLMWDWYYDKEDWAKVEE
jgi:phage-related minor tail protein